MRQYLKSICIVLFIFSEALSISYGQKKPEVQIADSLTLIANSYIRIGRINVLDFYANAKTSTIHVVVNDKFGYVPFRPDNVKRVYNAISKVIGKKYPDYAIVCQIDNRKIEDLIPNFYKPELLDSARLFSAPGLSTPLVRNISRPFNISEGLQNRHIALWQSHGKYFDQKQSRWVWQRARVFQVVEDLYTQSYVLPYLVPMLENAGANVLLPRERDTQTNEVIVDNDIRDGLSRYREQNDQKRWKKGDEPGFANTKDVYSQGENPFRLGTFREAPVVHNADNVSRVEWAPNILQEGRYAVYVSYKTLANSAADAHYTVYHKGGKTEFVVNQTMNGGTWLYLGHFNFDKGRSNDNRVVLTNLSSEEGKVVTADAVKFGGGMGNIARSPFVPVVTAVTVDSLSAVKPPIVTYEPEISRYPRFTEGARYWLQWAGIPDSIYSRTGGQNDYSDDFQSRGFWVNYLAGGSKVAPDRKGLNVPIDLALAFHSDAGVSLKDSIIGTLGIYTVQNTQGKTTFENGVSRWTSRDLTDIVQTQIVNDIRRKFAPEWVRRDMWNKSYSESRVPEVPTMLLELLSHQNFADMRYGLDPRFRFTVSRSVYKGLLRYLSLTNHTDYVVQPLPVEQFSCRFVEHNKLEVHWVATTDSLEPSARPDQYVIYTRVDNGDFDNGVLVNSDRLNITIPTGKIYSFKVTAVNKGGESFPSEILSAYRAPNEKGEVMIVNGFDRVSGPESFRSDTCAGFRNERDAGVPYQSEISYVGSQYDFKRTSPWVTDDAPGFGASHANYEGKVIAGNTFDYPYLHGKAIKAAGYSFVSCSEKSVLTSDIDLTQYKVVDLILGKQKQTFVGNAKKAPDFKTFPLALQQSLQTFCGRGGNLLVSGAYIGSDMGEAANPLREDVSFMENVLKFKFRTSQASVCGNVRIVNSPYKSFKKDDLTYFDEPNATSYYVESPDAIDPLGEGSYTICRYAENNSSAAVAYSGSYKTCCFGFPLEAIQQERDRTELMESVLSFFAGTPVALKK